MRGRIQQRDGGVDGGEMHLRLERLRGVGTLLQAVVAQHAGALTCESGDGSPEEEGLFSNMRGLIAQLSASGSRTSWLSS